MSTIEVVTSITGDKDFLRNDQEPGKAKYICFTDDKNLKSDLWEMRPAYDRFRDPRRNSRIHKILIHKYSQADLTIWIDANMRLVVPPEEVVNKYLLDYDMAMFKHGERDCIYDEAAECAVLKLDDAEILNEQAKYYETNEHARHNGLCSAFFIVRRNNQKTRDLNETWWADYCRFSRRDQISFMPAVDKVGVRINLIPEVWIQGDGFASRAGVLATQPHRHHNF